jgi:hypothetical protein
VVNVSEQQRRDAALEAGNFDLDSGDPEDEG